MKEKEFALKVITPNGVLLDVATCSVKLPAIDGSIGVLYGHAPYIISLTDGIVEYTADDGTKKSLETKKGIARIADNVVTVISD